MELPHGVVRFLNAAYHGSELPWGELEAALEQLWLWLEVHGAYTAWPEEEGLLDNIGYLLRQVEQGGDVRAPLETAVGLMNALLQERRRLGLCQDECLNDLLLAASATHPESEAVRERLPLALDRIACLRGRLEVFSEQLVPEFQAEIARGLERLEAALLAGSVQEAVQAALYADVFQEWERDWQQRSEQSFGKYAIPEVGPDLEEIVARGWQLDRSRWGLGVWRLRKVILPRLEAIWEERRQNALLTVPLEQVEQPVETALELFRQALPGLNDEQLTAEQALSALEEALLALSTAFARFESARLQRDSLSPTLAAYYDLAQGILLESVPDVHLAELLATEPPGAEAAVSLREYLSTRDEEHLTRALSHIAEHSRVLARERELQAEREGGLDGDLMRWSRAAACGGMF